MADDPRQTAFRQDAPAPERFDAQAEMQRAYRPTASELIPAPEIQRVIDHIREGHEEAELLKSARILRFPGNRRDEDPPTKGMRSVYLDNLQIFAHGDYWDKPSPVGFETLRQMVDQTPILSAVVLTRIRQISRFCAPQEDDGPGFVIRHLDREHAVTASERESLQALMRFMNHCGWEPNPRLRKRLKRDTFSRFMAKLVRDSLTMDAAPIETEYKRDASQGLDGLYAVDGATVRLCSDEGYHGDGEVFAVQVTQGRMVTAYTHQDLIYEVRNPRSDVRLAGYGLSETELLVRIVTGFLSALNLNIKGFDENAIPRGLLHLSGDYSQEDLAAFRRYWNAMVKGVQNAWSLPVLVSKDQEAKASFERFGVDWDEMYFSKWMTFLTSIACAVYGMSPDEINFESFAASKSSLSGADTEQKLADSMDKGLRPLMAYFEGLFSDYVIGDFSDKYCFRWTGIDEEDLDKRHELRKLLLTVNEARAQEGYDTLKGPLGDAPINPSLMGPWMQLQQGGSEDGGAARGGAEASKGTADDGWDAEDEDGDEDEKEGDDERDADRRGTLRKANPNHDDLGRVALHSTRKDPATIDAASIVRADNLNARSDGGDSLSILDLRQSGNATRLAKANPHHREQDGQFTFGVGERPGLFVRPDLTVVGSRNQVRSGERLSEAARRAKQYVLQAFAEAGGAVRNRDSRHAVMVTAASVGHLLHLGEKHQPLPDHIEAAFCAPELIRRAVLAERHPDRKDDNPNLYVARYYAPFYAGDRLYRCKLTVLEHRELGGSFKLYDHALAEIDLTLLQKESPALGGALRKPEYKEGWEGPPLSASSGALVSLSPGSRISVAHLLQGVNRDSDGLPFGTPAPVTKSLSPQPWVIEA